MSATAARFGDSLAEELCSHCIDGPSQMHITHGQAIGVVGGGLNFCISLGFVNALALVSNPHSTSRG
jgi:hypothetical protein